MKRNVDCIVRDLSDQTAFEISIVENVQRATLSPLEEARAFRKYVTEYGWGGVSELALRVGKSQAYVSHRILLLDLPEKIIAKLEESAINPSQAQELFWLDAPLRDEILSQIESEGLSVAEIRRVRKSLSSDNQLKMGSTSADSKPDFEFDNQRLSLASSFDVREKSKDHKTVEEAILALRIALIRLDSAIAKCESNTAKNILMDERLALHGQIDRLIRAKNCLRV
jgi:ParB family transcriptional regulator, chromosome partitioning protein